MEPREWLEPAAVPGGMDGFYKGVWFCRATEMPAKDLKRQTLARFLAAGLGLGPGAQTRTIGCVRLAAGATARGTGGDCNAFVAFADADVPRILAALAPAGPPDDAFRPAGGGAALAMAFDLERWTAGVADDFDPDFALAYPPPA